MKTPITDAAVASDESVSWEGEVWIDPEVARRLELDRAALIEALELSRATLGKLHASFSTPEEWQALWPAIKSAKAALSTARANFP
jgi:hypothetical protein